MAKANIPLANPNAQTDQSKARALAFKAAVKQRLKKRKALKAQEEDR